MRISLIVQGVRLCTNLRIFGRLRYRGLHLVPHRVQEVSLNLPLHQVTTRSSIVSRGVLVVLQSQRTVGHPLHHVQHLPQLLHQLGWQFQTPIRTLFLLLTQDTQQPIKCLNQSMVEQVGRIYLQDYQIFRSIALCITTVLQEEMEFILEQILVFSIVTTVQMDG